MREQLSHILLLSFVLGDYVLSDLYPKEKRAFYSFPAQRYCLMMAFRGLFIGIDRYSSPRIKWLGCASRDATALHALFTDTLGGSSMILTDAQATRAAIESEFTTLTQCDPDDVVFIAFSGHGSPSHELVAYDTDLDNLPTTGIPLDVLSDWFSKIPSRRLIFALDCCFSGGMGAKAVQMDLASRDVASEDAVLDQLSGNQRLVLTASAANEPAWENSKVGHGYLTFYLLEALQGATELRVGGKINIYDLLKYVSQHVIDAVKVLGRNQNPTIRGKVDGDVSWPVFVPGDNYRKAFPELQTQKIGADISNLAVCGFPDGILKAWAGAIPTLNQLQLDAINEFNLLRGDHIVVSAPTSSGKTMVGELAAIKGALERRRSFFLLPLKALVNDKHQAFTRTYDPFGIRTIRATGEISDDIPALMRGQYDICLMTYEKFASLVLGSPYLLEQVGLVVVDEVQMIADVSRGVNLEFVLTLLRMRRREGIEPQLIALSAVIGSTNGLERWLDARLLRRTERPVPLDEGLLLADGTFRYVDAGDGSEKRIDAYSRSEYRKGSSQDWVIPLVRKLVSEKKQVIVFRETKGDARGCANYLAESLGLPPATDALDALPAGDPSTASQALGKVLSGGVAFHISDLYRDERLAVEESFRAPNSKIRVIAATTTLAMGVNTPAEAVVIVGLEHPGPTPYSVAEYKNIVGRAGRLGFSDKGTSFLLAVNYRDEYDFWTRYIQGSPEDLESRFLFRETDPRSLVVRVLVAAKRYANQGLTLIEMVEFLNGSFAAFQQAQASSGWSWDQARLTHAVENLEQHGLIEKNDAGGYRLTELGWLAGQGGVEVESITRIIGALRGVAAPEMTDPTLIALTQLTVEVDSLLFPLNRKSTEKEPQTWKNELRNQGVPFGVLSALEWNVTEKSQSTLRAKKAVACLLWVTDMPVANIEAILTQFGGSLDGAAGPIRSVTARTCDLLPIVARIAEILHPELNLSKRCKLLLVRLEVGVPSTIAELASATASRLTRGDYLNLLKANCATADAIEKASDDVLLKALQNSELKVAEVRRLAHNLSHQPADTPLSTPLLPPYQP
jgi:helicase